MRQGIQVCILFTTTMSFAPVLVAGDEPAGRQAASCLSGDRREFADEVWTKVGRGTCLVCHKAGGDAEKSDFILRDPERSLADAQVEVQRQNRAAFSRMARLTTERGSRLLQKVRGELDHGGGEVLKGNSPEYRILADFVRSATGPTPATAEAPEAASDESSFFDGIVMIDDRGLLRRSTLSLAGRLPTAEEQAAIARDGLQALPSILDVVMI
jgi:hypothetical protein